MQVMKKSFRIHGSDNVATLLADAVTENIEVIGASLDSPILCCEAVSFGHKVAVFDIADNADVVKYGVVIGTAIQPIHAGQWVHLHNCRSRLDQRSATLDLHTGLSQDVRYE